MTAAEHGATRSTPPLKLASTGTLQYLRSGRAASPLRLRGSRRLGQARVACDDGPAALDVVLNAAGLPRCDERVLVTTELSRAEVVSIIQAESSSSLAIVLGDRTWALDRDQLAALLACRAEAEDGNQARSAVEVSEAPDEQQPPPFGIAQRAGQHATWTCNLYEVPRLRHPAQPTSGEKFRTLVNGLKSYGTLTAIDPPFDQPISGPDKVRFIVNTSVGGTSGHPGVELTVAGLARLNNGQTPSRRIRENDIVCLVASRRSAVGPADLRVPVVVRRRPVHASSSGIPGLCDDHWMGVDQVVRLAVGTSPWETVTLEVAGDRPPDAATPDAAVKAATRPVGSGRKRHRMGNRLAPVVRVVARVQPAELTLTEQSACVLSPLALDSMGLASGDHVKVTAAGKDGAVRRVKIKAYVAPEDVVKRRSSYYGGDMVSPLPSEEKALGMPAALPWIWLDAAMRNSLGIDGKLGAVIVQPNRAKVLVDSFREAALLVAIALAGAAASTSGATSLLFLAAAVAVPALLILWRIRSRLA